MAAAPAPATQPFLPGQSDDQHLPLKSYADAVHEAPIAREANGSGEVNGKEDGEGAKINGSAPRQKSTAHQASVLRIVASDAQEKNGSEGLNTSKHDLNRGVSKEEYSAEVRPAIPKEWVGYR
jgi:hypothetical protein